MVASLKFYLASASRSRLQMSITGRSSMQHLPAWRPTSFQRLCLSQQRHLYVRFQSTKSTSPAYRPRWQVTPSCPAPTCTCSATPEGLNIKRDGPMSMPRYRAHIIVRTGRTNWASKIEDDESSIEGQGWLDKPGPNLAKVLKQMLGPGGKYYNVSLAHWLQA